MHCPICNGVTQHIVNAQGQSLCVACLQRAQAHLAGAPMPQPPPPPPRMSYGPPPAYAYVMPPAPPPQPRRGAFRTGLGMGCGCFTAIGVTLLILFSAGLMTCASAAKASPTKPSAHEAPAVR